MERLVRNEGPMAANPNLHGCRQDNESLIKPVFYVDHRLGENPAVLITGLIGKDERFFAPPSPQGAAGHNYNNHEVLSKAILAGERGAFWDIVRRIQAGHATGD